MRDTAAQRRSRRVSDTTRNGAGNADTPVSDTLRESDTLARPGHRRRVSDTIRNGADNADTPVSDTLRESDTLTRPEHRRRVSDTFRRCLPRYAAGVYAVFDIRAPGVR